jgi:hypothetical protein
VHCLLLLLAGARVRVVRIAWRLHCCSCLQDPAAQLNISNAQLLHTRRYAEGELSQPVGGAPPLQLSKNVNFSMQVDRLRC